MQFGTFSNNISSVINDFIDSFPATGNGATLGSGTIFIDDAYRVYFKTYWQLSRLTSKRTFKCLSFVLAC
jgi:hypothetical protein